ncbi:hypothetical protein [Bacillus licheniformis]|uniref:hypothetical protein n=1 Tax=Bacillus licheniformis TaxID=1402 RepID=UPI00092A0DC1|nr:hypothetical protein [Bacillus licheniformis]OJT57569.1 hypothetical protein BFP47_12835 [Bacillus licheniformis]OJT69788.1 hypothetical protein BFP46_04050 [Bacillus licheniformis]
MDNSSTSVRSLIFSTHIERLKELLFKLHDGSITKEELRELSKIHLECMEMTAHVVGEANEFLLKSDLLPEDDAKEINELLHKIKESKKEKKDFSDLE